MLHRPPSWILRRGENRTWSTLEKMMPQKWSHVPYCDTHTQTFNGPFSGTTRVSRYQTGETNLDFTEARDSEWQWHQQG